MTMLYLLSLLAGVMSILSLAALHFISPELKPSWRLVSEYALGRHRWLLTLFFHLWGISSILLAMALRPDLDGALEITGAILLFVSGVGAICGGLFDVNHKLHGLAFLLGVPTLPAAALLLTYGLIPKRGMNSILVVSAHATWLSLVIMSVAMFVMFAGFKKAGVAWDKDSPPPTAVPDGVIALGGYANRLLVLCYIDWALLFAWFSS